MALRTFTRSFPALSRFAALVLALAALSVFAAACGGESADATPAPAERPAAATATPLPDPAPMADPTALPDTRTVSDDTGREVEIPYSPKSVAVTNAWMVELLMSCGHTPRRAPADSG